MPDRAFLCRLCDAMIGLSSPFHHVRVSAEMHADMGVWLAFIRHFHGVSFWGEVKLLRLTCRSILMLQAAPVSVCILGEGGVQHIGWMPGLRVRYEVISSFLSCFP